MNQVQQAQIEFRQIQSVLRDWPTHFASKRLMVLPDRIMAKFGGALAIYGCICICPKLINAPDEVRIAVLAHEWGHIARGHCLATLSTLGLALVYAYRTITLQGTVTNAVISLTLLAIIAAILFWALNEKREFEADEMAAKVVGKNAMLECLYWIRDNVRNGEESETMQKRIRILQGGG